MNRTTAIIITLFMLIGCVFPLHAMQPLVGFGNPLIGKEAPDFTLDTTEDNVLSIREYREEKSAILFFWATWCPHCRRELIRIQENLSMMDQRGIRMIFINVSEDPQTVRSYLDKNRLDIEVFLDGEGKVADDYGVYGLPTFIFVDRDGIIKKIEHVLPENYEEILMAG